jgi:nitrite reductase/ring-hydroxylating ferredoxin subunit
MGRGSGCARRGAVIHSGPVPAGPEAALYRKIPPRGTESAQAFALLPGKAEGCFQASEGANSNQFKEEPASNPAYNVGVEGRHRPGRPLEESSHMAEKFVAKASEMQDGDRRIVFVGDNEIGVFRHDGKYYAYSNFCLHQGGPACEGLTIAKVEERLRPDKTSQGLYFSETDMNFVCPWHGMEYDMKTGECISDRKMKLKKFQVLEKGDEVYVVA